MIDAINAYNPNPRAILTTYKGVKHEAWEKAYLPDHSIHSPNVYEWMMSKSKTNLTNQQVENRAPLVNAGSDKEISSNQSNIELSGTASDEDGGISRYEWSKLSGGNIRMDGKTTSRLKLSSYHPGSYTFRLTVWDNRGTAKSDDVKLTVVEPPVTGLVALAGPDRHVRLPVKTYTLAGGAKSNGGYITSYEWEQVDGEALSLTNTKTRVMTISDVRTSGKRTFALTVTDTKGRKARDHVRIYFESTTSGGSFDEAIVVDEPAQKEKVENAFDQYWDNCFVTVYNERGEKVFAGVWGKTEFSDVFAGKGLYIYKVISRAGGLRSGKVFIQ
jgi:hypothetical protein